MRNLIFYIILALPLNFSLDLSLNLNQALAQVDATKNPSQKPEKPPKILKSQKLMWVAHILRDKGADKKLDGLEILAEQVPVYLVPQEENFRPLVKMKINYNKPGWTLFLNDKEPVRKVNELGEHIVYAYLRSRISTMSITAVGPKRETQTETLYLFAPEAREYKMVSVFDSVLFTVGHSFLVYRQSSFGTFVSQSLLLGAKYISPEKGYNLGYFADSYITAYTYTSSPIKESPQFFEARAGLSYLIKMTKNPKYRTRFTLGASTVNLFSFGSPFGFSGLYGSNLGVRTEFYRSAKNSYAGELQITPYDYSDPFAQRSVKLSVDWNYNLSNLRRAHYGMSYTNHMFSQDNEKINSDQLNLYFSLSF